MDTSLYIAFMGAALVLIVVPGPTVMLVASRSLDQGIRAGLVTVAGCAVAAAIQLAIVVAGLGAVIVFVREWFDWIRWAGVVYLVYLGISTWLRAGDDASVSASHLPTGNSYRHFIDGFVVTLTNPKMLLFLGAFLQQFIDPARPALPQLMILAGSFLLLAVILDSLWALLAARLGGLLAGRRTPRYANRLAALVLIGTGVTLALIRR